MTENETESAHSTRSTKPRFTRGHEILLGGLIGSGMNYRDIFHLEMSLTTEKEALELAIWIRDRLDEKDGFPTPKEIIRHARIVSKGQAGWIVADDKEALCPKER